MNPLNQLSLEEIKNFIEYLFEEGINCEKITMLEAIKKFKKDSN